MDFLIETKKMEKIIQSSINQYNALDLRKKAQFCASLIETSKFSMDLGRTYRAWSFLLMARKYWESVLRRNH